MISKLKHTIKSHPKVLYILPLALLLTGIVLSQSPALARRSALPESQISPMHPTFPLLDAAGEHVLESGNPVSTMTTCGACHDTDFIANHSFHVSVGLKDLTEAGATATQRPWDISPGLFGQWNPLFYRYLSPRGDERVDLTTAEWIQTYGTRHVGGGPAVTSRDGEALTELEPQAGDVETSIRDPESGSLVSWDWAESGVVEMNCFLCHTPSPNNEARTQELEKGNFKWANTATLLGTGIVTREDDTYRWAEDAFQSNGELTDEAVTIQDPTNENCGQCHGLVHDDVEDPLVTSGCSPEKWSTITTGQIVSPQKMSDSGMNLADKQELDRAWDVHAERLLVCTDCHYSLNNPLYYKESDRTQPDHLLFDPRRLAIGEYLLTPLHQFARGDSAQSNIAPELKNTIRNCDSCHTMENTHEWLPYHERHLEALSCESCHIPKLFSSANMVHDWTVLTEEHYASLTCRGAEGDVDTMETLLTGYQPVLLPNREKDGDSRLTPHNLITTWFWVYGDPPRPVRLSDLKDAYFENGSYHPGVLARFDADSDGQLREAELVIDTPAKEQFIKDRLIRLGLGNPRIVGEIQPYSIHHDIATAEWAVRDCSECHGKQSRVTQPIQLAPSAPGGVLPQPVSGSSTSLDGDITVTEDGALFYHPQPHNQNLYILGHDNVAWVDLLGAILFLGVALGVTAHGGLRYYATRQHAGEHVETREVYMYGFYERLWHWLQTASILLLLLTGLIIHKPDIFGIFDFRGVVIVHNVLAAIVIINAALSLFYHLASGEIKQYLPQPQGFFDRAIAQAVFYLRGIFRGQEHPFVKRPEKKLNPLQQITYLALLNVLLPLQIITGALMWGAQRWPALVTRLGGLPFLAPLHTLVAWLFASFILLHVYLTTTGHTPLASIKAMILGWEEIETQSQGEAQGQE